MQNRSLYSLVLSQQLVTLFIMRVKLFRKVEDEAKNHESDIVGSRDLPLCGEK